MFEVGSKYEIVTGLGDEEGSSVFTVVEFELPLLKVIDGAGHEFIFNTGTPSFVSANRPTPRIVGTDAEGWPKR